jgi:hypothetical protein
LLGHGVRFGACIDVMAAGEGIETMLSLRTALPSLPVVAALSANHLAALLFPATLRRLYVARDNDPAGEFALAALTERAQVNARGATWLDRQLVGRTPAELSAGGFGGEVRLAMEGRIDHLVGERLARRQGPRVVFARDLLETLRQRDLDTKAAEIGSSTGLRHYPVQEGDVVAGTYRRRLDLASGRFAMMDDGLGFSLVPWSPSLERHLGQELSGTVRAGRVEWSFTRSRGLEIS